MKYLIVFLFIFVLNLACANPTPIEAQNQFGIINVSKFHDERVGIIPLVLAMKPVREEIYAKELDYKNMLEKQKELSVELSQLNSKQTSNSTSQIADKIKEYEMLNQKIADYKKNAQDEFEKRRKEATKDINKKIGESIKQFTKEKNYTVIIIDNTQDPIIEDATEVTLEFIEYFHMNTKNW